MFLRWHSIFCHIFNYKENRIKQTNLVYIYSSLYSQCVGGVGSSSSQHCQHLLHLDQVKKL